MIPYSRACAALLSPEHHFGRLLAPIPVEQAEHHHREHPTWISGVEKWTSSQAIHRSGQYDSDTAAQHMSAHKVTVGFGSRDFRQEVR